MSERSTHAELVQQLQEHSQPCETLGIVESARERRLLNSYLSRLSQRAREVLRREVCFHVLRLLPTQEDREEHAPYLFEEHLQVKLRVAFRPLTIFLPAELLQEFDKTEVASLEQLKTTIAQLLVDEALFSRHRVYLSSVKRIAGVENSAVTRGDQRNLALELRLDHNTFPIIAIYDSALVKRLQHYAGLLSPNEIERDSISAAKTSWDVHINFGLRSIMDLLLLGPGQRLPIEGAECGGIRCTLRQANSKAILQGKVTDVSRAGVLELTTSVKQL